MTIIEELRPRHLEPEHLRPDEQPERYSDLPTGLGVLLATDDEEWQVHARCRDLAATITGLFFSDNQIDMARAKAICGRCPVSVPCLEAALARREPWGVWGGELLENGRIVANRRPRGRPPKIPRPPLVVDEVILPPVRRRTPIATAS